VTLDIMTEVVGNTDSVCTFVQMFQLLFYFGGNISFVLSYDYISSIVESTSSLTSSATS